MTKKSHVPKEIPLTSKEIEEMMKKSAKYIWDAVHEDKSIGDARTGECVVCDGKVVARVTREYLGDSRHAIIGPGSKNQMTTVHHGFHCVKCGLKYEFPPKYE